VRMKFVSDVFFFDGRKVTYRPQNGKRRRCLPPAFADYRVVTVPLPLQTDGCIDHRNAAIGHRGCFRARGDFSEQVAGSLHPVRHVLEIHRGIDAGRPRVPLERILEVHPKLKRQALFDPNVLVSREAGADLPRQVEGIPSRVAEAVLRRISKIGNTVDGRVMEALIEPVRSQILPGRTQFGRSDQNRPSRDPDIAGKVGVWTVGEAPRDRIARVNVVLPYQIPATEGIIERAALVHPPLALADGQIVSEVTHVVQTAVEVRRAFIQIAVDNGAADAAAVDALRIGEKGIPVQSVVQTLLNVNRARVIGRVAHVLAIRDGAEVRIGPVNLIVCKTKSSTR
jgi:hypothetical protein